MNRLFLVIGEERALWAQTLDRVLARWGKLYIVSAEKAREAILENDYELIVVDAGAVEQAALLVSHLHARQPDASLIVVSASPTWQQAKEVLQAGAVDYMWKSLDEKEIERDLGAVLQSLLSHSAEGNDE